VYRLTQSTFALGLVVFLTEIAGTTVALFAGLLVDRFSAPRIMLGTQSAALLQALALAGFAAAGLLDFFSIIVLCCVYGVINGIDVPARQVLLVHLVERREHVAKAVALASFALDLARLIGPALGGVVIARGGESVCFLLNALSYLAVIAALVMMRPAVHGRVPRASAVNLRDGIKYAFRISAMRRVLMLVALVSLTGSPSAVLMPVITAEELGGGPPMLGLLVTAPGIGALAGAVYLSLRSPAREYRRVIGFGAALFGLSLVLFAASEDVVLSVVFLTLSGFGIVLLMASSQAFLLTFAEESNRGRVMALFTVSFMATVPFGSLAGGSLAVFAGAPIVIAAGGALAFFGGLAFWLSSGDIGTS
jgi:MFS family permease